MRRTICAGLVALLALSGCAQKIEPLPISQSSTPSSVEPESGIQNAEEPAKTAKVDSSSLPQAESSCAGDFVIGLFEGKEVVLSCGPDGRWHPQMRSDQSIVLPTDPDSPITVATASGGSNPLQADEVDETDGKAGGEDVGEAKQEEIKHDDLSLFKQSAATVDPFVVGVSYNLVSKANLVIAPSLGSNIASDNTEALSIIGKVWSRFYQPSRLTVLLWDGNDVEWGLEKNRELRLASDTFMFDGCTGGNAGNEWSQISCIENWYKPWSWEKTELVAHEYTHNIQWTVGGDFNGNVQDYDRMWEIPSSFREGSATYYGWYVASQKSRDIAGHIWSHTRGLSCMYDTGGRMKLDIATEQDFISEMRAIETGSGYWSKQYVYGGFMTMILLAKYGGHRAFMDFYTGIRNGSDWENAFENSFGLDKESFYKAAFSDFQRFSDFMECEQPR